MATETRNEMNKDTNNTALWAVVVIAAILFAWGTYGYNFNGNYRQNSSTLLGTPNTGLNGAGNTNTATGTTGR